jgi:SAM-dependent methyltransferase
VTTGPDTGRTEPTVWALANASAYDEAEAESYVRGAPHLRHASLWRRYEAHVQRLLDAVRPQGPLAVLELGAGEGTTSLPFLRRGANVVAVDVSEAQLESLRRRAEELGGQVETICADADAAIDLLRTEGRTFDVVSATSFLHHVPDYVGVLREAVPLVAAGGALGTFQDPLRYAGLGRSTRLFAQVAYAAWRLQEGDRLGGLRRRLRRSVVGFDEVSKDDAIEYHAQRGGVDQRAVAGLLERNGFDVRLDRYFSTQSPVFQALGERLGLVTSFSIVARRRTAA